MPNDPAQLDAALLAAHDTMDRDQLVTLYTKAADITDDTDAACFFLTHAYVFALEAGHPATAKLLRRLQDQGRA